MLLGDAKASEKADKIVKELGTHSLTLSHNRHLSIERCKEIGLIIEDLEASQRFQDAVLSVHHACMHTLSSTPAYKIIENHNGIAFINQIKQVVIQN